MSDTKLDQAQLDCALDRANGLVVGDSMESGYSADVFMACAMLNARRALVKRGVPLKDLDGLMRGDET